MKPETFNYNDYLRLQAEMDKRNEYANALIAEVEQLQSDLDRVTAERDAAVEDLHHCENACEYCANAYRCNQNECSILDTQTGECVDAWKWRGERSE